MAYKIIVQPSEEPVSLAEAKDHCSVDESGFNGMITAMIVAARESAEHELNRALCTQTRELVLDAFPEAFILSGAPVKTLVSVKFIDSAGVEQALDPDDTLLDKDSEPGYLLPGYGKSWPDTYPVPNAVRVQYTCGYGAAAAVPSSIKSWMLLAVGAMFAQREAFAVNQSSSLPDRFWHRLLDPHRVYL